MLQPNEAPDNFIGKKSTQNIFIFKEKFMHFLSPMLVAVTFMAFFFNIDIIF